jgi:AraC-like DNA-binding protein
MGGGGETTRFVCGYIACDPHSSPLLFAGLPRLCVLNLRTEPAASWLEHSIRVALGGSHSGHPGADAVRARISEALFGEALRRYIGSLPLQETGWLAGARDPIVGKALALLHDQPARPWTTSTLAAASGASRSVLAERFRRCAGQPPMSYLTRWRLRLGSRRLKESCRAIAQIAADVGYDSEAAFNRAFKREFGVTPARFRAQQRSATPA